MEFPGLLGVGLFRLRTWLREAPLAALGPLFGFIAADIAIDLSRGRLTSVGIDLVIAPLLAQLVSTTARRPHPGLSGTLLLVLGVVSALGASIMLSLALGHGVGVLFMVGLRHLVVAAYAWAAIAEEPPPRRRVTFRPLRT